MRVFQHLDSWKKADGIGEDVYGLAQVFSKLNIESFIVTRITLESLITTNIKTINITEIPEPFEHDLHILHYGGAGYPLDFFLPLSGKKILRFHNYTPSYFFKSEIDAELALRMRDLQVRTEIELKSLSIYCESSWCDSTFNAEVLQEFGFKAVKILPICKQFKIVSSEANKNTKLHLGFISRFSPQKKWEDILDVFQIWNKLHPESYLDCIGTRVPAFEKYFNFIVEEVKRKNLEDRVRFHFQVSESEKESITETWFASLCLSDHEGFGLPILESFGSGILTLVNQAGATKETAGDAGILINEKNPLKISFLLEYFLENPELCAKVIQKQKERVKYHNSFDFKSFVERECAFRVY